MKQAFSVDETIARPAEAVWQAMVDWEHAGRWMHGIDRLEAQGPLAPGTTLTFHTRGKTRQAEIAVCEPGERLVLRSRQGAVEAEYAYALEPLDPERTRVSLTARCAVSGPLSLFAPMLRWLVARTDGDQIAALGAWLETK